MPGSVPETIAPLYLPHSAGDWDDTPVPDGSSQNQCASSDRVNFSPAQRVGRPQPRASEAEGRCPRKKRHPHRCDLKGRENPRKLRFIPHSRTLIAITCRTIQGRFLLRPGPQSNGTILGILGRAQRRYETTISAFSILSNHLHLLLIVDSPREAADFMRYTKSKLAREVNRLTGWRGPVFDRRYEMTVVTDEESAQIERLAYTLAQSVKEGLVERVNQWPGVHSAGALIDGTPLVGHWYNRTLEFAAHLRGVDVDPMRYATVETVNLSPIPCWAHLSPEVYRARIAELVESIEAEAARARERTGASVLGVPAILSRDPQHRPASLARSPAPRVHAATKAARKAFYEIYAAFVAAFREASERLRRGDRNAPFPIGSFPPALPFVAG